MAYDDKTIEPVTWSYVAGFTDGEGCISIKKAYGTNVSFDITLSQVTDNDWVLHEIQLFLKEHGISCKIYTQDRSHTPWRDCSFLQMRRVHDIYLFLRNVLPYLIVKRGRAIQVLKAIELKAQHTDKPAVYSWLREGGD
jgi:LAGLIDADG endonuclease